MRRGSVGDSQLPPNFDAPVAQQGAQKPSTFEIITQLALPIALTVVVALNPDSRLFWALLVAAFIPVILKTYPLLTQRVGRWRARIRDKRDARQAYDKFSDYVADFGAFVGVDSADYLGKVVDREFKSQEEIVTAKSLGMTDEMVFKGFWYRLADRVGKEEPSLAHLVELVKDFNHLVSIYLRETVKPVFDGMPEPIRESLSVRTRSKLESFREGLTHFVKDYQSFATKLARSLETTDLRDPNFELPDPHA